MGVIPVWKLSLRIYNRNPELQTRGVEFERCEYLPGREGLTKDAIDLHYGKGKI